MKRVYCLYRVSTKGQVDKDDIPMQKTSCREFAEHNGWTILKEFQEKGVSGFKVSARNRDAIQDLKAAAEKKEFDVLLVFMFDRIGRIDDETPFVVEWFIKHGIEVWSVNEGEQRMDNHVDKLMNYIRFWQANGESQKTSARVKTRLNQMTLDGKFTGGVAPFGYKLIKSGEINKKGKELMDIVVDDDEAPIVKKIFEMTVKEGYGSYRMADFLNSHGIRTHNNSKFQCNTVNRILKNRLYCGYLVSGGVESPYIERLHIIDENIFDQAQFILKQRSSKNEEKQQIARTTKGSTLLSGNIYCAHCGQKMVSTSYIDRYDRAEKLSEKTRDFTIDDSKQKYYKPVVDDGEEKDFNRKNSGKKITVKAHKTMGSNDIYLSDKVKLKRKQFHKFDKNVTKIYEMLGQSKSENKPAICILSPEEMGKNAVATYIPTDNVLTVNSAYFITKNLAELQKPFACPDSELSSVLHELIHWQDAEKYRQKFGEITDYNAYCDYLNKIYAPKVEKLIKSGYNISDISEYAKLEFRKNEFDEVHAEFCVKQLLQR